MAAERQGRGPEGGAGVGAGPAANVSAWGEGREPLEMSLGLQLAGAPGGISSRLAPPRLWAPITASVNRGLTGK